MAYILHRDDSRRLLMYQQMILSGTVNNHDILFNFRDFQDDDFKVLKDSYVVINRQNYKAKFTADYMQAVKIALRSIE